MIKPIPGPENISRRVVVIVLDGAGAGALPDAEDYGDQGSNTLLNVIADYGPLVIPNLMSLGLGKILKYYDTNNTASSNTCLYGKMAPLSPGKDTTSGHWELAGLVLENPFPVFPQGFPPEITDAFKKAIGRGLLGNYAASGTVIIEELGEEHLETGFPIIYTSADSVFQIAAHEDIVPPELLYKWCLKARKLLQGEYAVGRVIARPFAGELGKFKRTKGRHDYSLTPPGETLLDWCENEGFPVAVIGKVADIFAHRSISVHRPGGDNNAIGEDLIFLLKNHRKGLIWATFGDFDTVYGHRNDGEGFAAALERFDSTLTDILSKLGHDDLLMITADHGCDPTFPTTDHTREYVPIIAWNPAISGSRYIGTRSSFADLAASAVKWLNINRAVRGRSFLDGQLPT